MKTDSSLPGMDLGTQQKSRTQNNANRRRFNDEQIKYLEFMFEEQSRPESQIKQQLANEIGLEPRQVSIWFQNRRARLKTKQVEREYNKLKAIHDALASSFESLKTENQSLLIQLQKLKKMQAMQHENRNCTLDKTKSSSDQRIESRDANLESKEQPSYLLLGCDDNGNIESTTTREETETFKLNDSKEVSKKSSDWRNFDSNTFLDESCCSSEWWEFLP